MPASSPIQHLDLSGKVAVVTGCNGGIGQSTVEHLHALGAKVHGTDLDQLSTLNGSALESYRPADLGGDASLEACCAWIADLKPDSLVNNAALFDLGVFLAVLGSVMLMLYSLSRIARTAGETVNIEPMDFDPADRVQTEQEAK